MQSVNTKHHRVCIGTGGSCANARSPGVGRNGSDCALSLSKPWTTSLDNIPIPTDANRMVYHPTAARRVVEADANHPPNEETDMDPYDIEIGDLCEFRETAGGGPVCHVARGTVLSVGRQQSATNTRIEDVAIVAWDESRDRPAVVTAVPLWNARFRSLSAVDRARSRASEQSIRDTRHGYSPGRDQ